MKVCALADKFKGMLEKFKSKQEIFDSVLDGSVGKYVIHGNSINIVVPDQIVKDHEDEIIKVFGVSILFELNHIPKRKSYISKYSK